MSEHNREQIQRILFVIDSMPDHEMMQSVAEFARQLQAELSCLFVEDINLWRLAELPDAQEIGYTSAKEQALNLKRIERLFSVQAKEVRKIFDLIVQPTTSAASLQIVRGQLVPEVLLLAEHVDMIILARKAALTSFTGNPVLVMRQLAQKFQGPIALLQVAAWLNHLSAVIIDDFASARKVLNIALHIIGKNSFLRVLIITDSTKAYAKLQKELINTVALQHKQHMLSFAQLSSQFTDLITLLRQQHITTLILSKHHSLCEDANLRAQLLRSNISIIWVDG